MGYLSDKIDSWSATGLKVPFARDAATNKPSVTLFFAYITFLIACVSIICMHFLEKLALATWTSMGFWFLATVLYMMRQISKAKLNFKDKSVDLEDDESKQP